MNSIGFRDDCIHLINAYCEHKSTDFQLFCDEWKRKGFHYVFTGFSFQHELVASTEYYFISLMNIFCSVTSIGERIAALYLMYSLYFKQPTKDFCKFRFTLSDWQKMKLFYERISGDSKYLQGCAIFWRLWQSHAFRLVACDLEQYAQVIQNNRNNAEAPSFHKINSEVIGTLKSLKDENKGLACAIETLQVGYNEMKDHFKANFGECSSFRGINVLKEIDSKLNNIHKIFANDDDDDEMSGQSYLMNLMDGPDTELSSDNEMNNEKAKLANVGSKDFNGLNIGSKRALLRQKAMNQTNDEIRCLKSSIKDLNPLGPSSSLESKSKEKQTQPRSKHIDNNICIKVEPNSDQYIVDNGGNVMINHPKKVYNRNAGSSVERQITDCPTEVSTEIDSKQRQHERARRK